MRRRRASKIRRFKKARKNGTLPRRPKGGGSRPPGVPWSGKRNPSTFADVGAIILPAAGGFVATRVVSRIASSVASKHRPGLTKHVNVLAGVASFAGLWFFGHRVKYIAPYHTPVVVGSGIAALQSAVQTYLPKYGWLLGHPSEEMASTALPSGPSSTGDYLDEVVDEFTYDDGGGLNPAAPPPPGAGGRAPNVTDTVEEALNDLDMDEDDLYQGTFSN